MSGSDIMALCSRQVSTALTTEVGWAENGEFLPLGVWKTNGWDIEAIESKAAPEDMRMDPKYGFTLYRVNIHSTQQGQKRTTDDHLQLLAKGRTRALRRKATDEVSVKSLQEEAASEDRSFSNEDSDSQEDNRPLAKPKKKAKAAAKKAKKEDPAAKKVKAAAKAAVKNHKPPERLAHNLRAQVRYGG